MAYLEIRTKSRVNSKSTYLRQYARNVTSQCGEDGIIEKIFATIGTTNKWCVEFGAWDGKLYSNTWTLINNDEWKGVLIEGDKKKFEDLTQSYSANRAVTLVNQYVEPESGNTLDSILANTSIPTDFDCLSIDVDGLDWHIWKSLVKFKPRFVIIEFNPTIPNDVCFIQDSDRSLHHGSSLLAAIELGKKKGYELVATTDWNAFFVAQELFPLFGIHDNDIDAMHAMGNFESKLFQLYDGTLVLGGNNKLLWRGGMVIHQSDIQVLPVAQRKFG